MLNGHDGYAGLGISERKAHLVQFFFDVRALPISYAAFVYERRLVGDQRQFASRMRRDLSDLLFKNLGYFQRFETVKVYYDGGQGIVSEALLCLRVRPVPRCR